MQQTILIVGPSGVGKTSAYLAIEGRFPGVFFRHLDGLASAFALRHGWISSDDVHELDRWAKNGDHFLAIGLQAITDLAVRHPEHHLVIDVGAGFQKGTYATRLYRQYPVITLHADPSVAHARWSTRAANTGSLEFYISYEFTDHRKAVYERSHHQIDTTHLAPEAVADALACKVSEILGPAAVG